MNTASALRLSSPPWTPWTQTETNPLPLGQGVHGQVEHSRCRRQFRVHFRKTFTNTHDQETLSDREGLEQLTSLYYFR